MAGLSVFLAAATDTSTLSLVTSGTSMVALGGYCLKLYNRNTFLEDRSRNDALAAQKATSDMAATLKDVVKTVERFQQQLDRIEAKGA